MAAGPGLSQDPNTCACRRRGREESQLSQHQSCSHKLLAGSTHRLAPASQTAFTEMGPGLGQGWGVACWRVAVTCWLVPAAAASYRHGTRCSRRPCSGPCTWRCTSGDGEGARLRCGPRPAPPPRQRIAHAPRPQRVAQLVRVHAQRPPRRVRARDPAGPPRLPAPNCPGSPPASRCTSGSTCPSSSVGTREPSVATPAPGGPRHPRPPAPAPDLQQLLRVGHGDLHFHLLHDKPRVQLPAAGAPEIRAEATLHGSAKSTGQRQRVPTCTHAGSRTPQGPTGNGVRMRWGAGLQLQ